MCAWCVRDGCVRFESRENFLVGFSDVEYSAILCEMMFVICESDSILIVLSIKVEDYFF